ncbi:glycosyl-phosphatidylinositol-anchored molecule-like protein [Phodopus roborovskii]|uniref:glycosyl-phosphatidylinositol-anchored molecule-like protein n=1 Tax=Phodopus roborovskii TaxID=109678 RepID=UPI0021E50FD4|nr:glycosyl-phosphatidylinositol-anchored molecule-like protein [Phodopus roborovskii]
MVVALRKSWFTCVLEIMLPFFWLILLGLSWTDTSVNRASVEGNSTSELGIAIQPKQGMNSRALLVFKHCMKDCPFVLIQPPPTELSRRLPNTNSFYYSNCCSGVLCNDGGPTNVERDLLPPLVVEEDVVARAVSPEECNLLLTLALILSSSILT